MKGSGGMASCPGSPAVRGRDPNAYCYWDPVNGYRELTHDAAWAIYFRRLKKGK